jgi:hypothetical protein
MVGVWRATRETEPHRWRAGFVAAFITWIATGAIDFIGVAAVIYTVLHTGIASQLQTHSPSVSRIPAVAGGPITIGAAAALATITVVIGCLTGLLALSARYLQTRLPNPELRHTTST